MSSEHAIRATLWNIIHAAHPLSQKKASKLICYYVRKLSNMGYNKQEDTHRKFMDDWLLQRRVFNISNGYTNKGRRVDCDGLYEVIKDKLYKRKVLQGKIDLSDPKMKLDTIRCKVRKGVVVMGWNECLNDEIDRKYFTKLEVSKNNASFVYRTLRDLKTQDARRRKNQKRRKRRTLN